MKRSPLTIAILIIAMFWVASGVAAQDEPAAEETPTVDQPKVRDWILRFGLVVAETSGTTSVDADPGTVDVRLSGGGGGFANLEYKIVPFLGLEFGTTAYGADMNVSTHGGYKHIGADVDILGVSALTLGTNFRFVRTRAVNVYAGPLVAFNRYSKWSVHTEYDDEWWPAKHGHDQWVSVRWKTDSELTWGAKIGIDIVLTKRGNWTFGGSLTYLDATYNFDQEDGAGSGSVNLNPILFSFGGGFRF